MEVSSIHCHKNQSDEIDVSARRRLICASILCLSFMLFEVVGGILANSLAIATDAAHLLTDFASFMISLFSLWMAGRPATKRLSFGWYRAEVIGALTSVIMIWAVTGVLVYMAILRMINKEYNIQADIMLISATVGVIVNVIMGLALQIHPPRTFGHSQTSEDSARPTEITTTEPFVPCHPNVDSSQESPGSPELLGIEWIPTFANSQADHLPAQSSLKTNESFPISEPTLLPSPRHSPDTAVPTSPQLSDSPIPPGSSTPPFNTTPQHEVQWSAPEVLQTTEATEPGAAPDEKEAIYPASNVIDAALNNKQQGAKRDSSIENSLEASACFQALGQQPPAPTVGATVSFPDVKLGPTSSVQEASCAARDVQQNTQEAASSQYPRLERGSPQGAMLVGTGGGSRVKVGPPLPTPGAAKRPVERTGTEAPPERHDGVMNLNVRAAFIHVLGDLIQSVGVLLAAIIIYFCPNCGVVDPICTLLFSVIVLVTTLAILKEALNVLMEGIPRSVDYHQVRAMLLSVQGVARVHDLHIWSLSLDKLAVSAHVVLVPGANAMEVRRNASRAIRRSFDVFKLTLQMEEYEEGIRHHCRQCNEPN
ncbi:proton-coupled zinc antiporter SLC30A2-like [Ixodes scapularis]